MDALFRRERHQQLQDQSRPADAQHTKQQNVIDLTDSRSPSPAVANASSLFHRPKSASPSKPANSAVAHSSGSQPIAQTWSLPARNKHAGPAKVRMLDVGSMPPEVAKSPAKAKPMAAALAPSSSRKIQDAFATTDIQSKSYAHPQPWRFVGASKAAIDVDVGVDDDDDDDVSANMPAPAGPDASAPASERDAQLQNMLNNMVLAPEIGDIDVESASRIEGLRCRLLPHQVAGYLWLKGREAGSSKGGILADDMGLGKTIQMLALIIGNSPRQSNRTIDIRQTAVKSGKQKATPPMNGTVDQEEVRIKLQSHTSLVIAPLAVIRQWEREIKEKSSPQLKVLVHHGPQRVRDARMFTRYDVVITTYTTAASEFNNMYGKPKGKGSGASANVSDSESSSSEGSSSDDSRPARRKKSQQSAQQSRSPLYNCDWLRVILDEAQNIKNHKTQASSAAAMLSRRALSKWCLSGTPIQNDCIELFSLIRFMGIPPFDNFAHFKEKIADPLKSTNQNRVNWGMKRLCAVLSTIMLRRTKDATFNGQPILSLPERSVQIVSIDFDDEKERGFYDDLETQVKKNISSAEETGKKMNHMVTLLMLLRLRQACNHPSLVSRSIKVDAGAATSVGAVDNTLNSSDVASSQRQGDDDDDDGLAALLAGLSVVSKRCDRCQVDLTAEEAKAGIHHCAFCRERLRREREGANGIDRWSNVASTKIRAMLSILAGVRTNGQAKEKTIIFSQFTSFLDLVEPFLRQHGYNYTRYDGSLRPDERERALERIRSDDATRVILISFKAGNTGLNLTSCSRVILMDLWWNPMLEAQAIDRAHRLGQTRPVVVYKLVIKRSVEERILALQDKKRALAEAALEGSKLTKQNRLDRNELMYLFSGAPVA